MSAGASLSSDVQRICEPFGLRYRSPLAYHRAPFGLSLSKSCSVLLGFPAGGVRAGLRAGPSYPFGLRYRSPCVLPRPVRTDPSFDRLRTIGNTSSGQGAPDGASKCSAHLRHIQKPHSSPVRTEPVEVQRVAQPGFDKLSPNGDGGMRIGARAKPTFNKAKPNDPHADSPSGEPIQHRARPSTRQSLAFSPEPVEGSARTGLEVRPNGMSDAATHTAIYKHHKGLPL